MRVKLHNVWQSAQTTLAKKQETEQKVQAGGKPEKIQQIQQEIQEVCGWGPAVDTGVGCELISLYSGRRRWRKGKLTLMMRQRT